jgi:N-acetyl-alpha-D-glucosaminyl L-malate synthase BshA
MHVSNFRKVKNPLTVVEVFRIVRGEIPALLVLVGDGPERPSLMSRLHELDLMDDVMVLGLQESVEDILPDADALLLPSDHESFGLAALEAMAAAVPVIATNRGGTVEVVEEGISGFLRDPQDVEGMAQAVLKVLRDPDLGSEMGRKGRERAEKLFNPRAVVARYRDLYLELLDSK